jgi:hypothetical protein
VPARRRASRRKEKRGKLEDGADRAGSEAHCNLSSACTADAVRRNSTYRLPFLTTIHRGDLNRTMLT